jgi:hypothetical protein
MEKKKEDYLRRAVEAEKWAAEAKTEKAKEGWLRVAAIWRLSCEAPSRQGERLHTAGERRRTS